MPYRYGYARYSLGSGDGKGGYPPDNGLVSWTPADLPAIVHWYRVSDIVGLNNTDPVSTWSDTIGSSDLSGAGAARPLYYTNSGDPYIQFDGSNDVMTGTFPAGFTDYSIVVIAEYVTVIDYGQIFGQGFFGGLSLYPVGGNNYMTNQASNLIVPGVPSGFFALYGERVGSNAKLRINGSENTGAGYSTSTTSTSFAIGAYPDGTTNGNIRLKELILCTDAITGTDFTSLAGYVSDTYGLTI